ncbi:hypothetical protein AAW51_4105 [Caldimonas brevitalea]|uniref:Uncharacterized protein n=1 Tax=Caldimonas brevitalea TaxID=413882 RepID=A0A0G3BTW5_9BURK|nr:hypothetical protein AAW51_4105 [Caldimonas brevitalea]
MGVQSMQHLMQCKADRQGVSEPAAALQTKQAQDLGMGDRRPGYGP